MSNGASAGKIAFLNLKEISACGDKKNISLIMTQFVKQDY